MKILDISYVFIISLLTLGCGTSDQEEPQENAYPVFSIEGPKEVFERELVSLSASSSDNAEVVRYEWHQKEGIAVSIQETNKPTIAFNAPSISLSEGVQEITFELSVTNISNLTSTSEVTIKVTPVSQAPVIALASNELRSKSGAFTMLEWDIVQSEPITNITLTSDNSTFELIDITDNEAVFNAPIAFDQENVSLLILTVTDEDGNSTNSSINLTAFPVDKLFKEPKLIHLQEKGIASISDKLGNIIIKSENSYSEQDLHAFNFIDGKLVLDSDYSLNAYFVGSNRLKSVNNNPYFIDFNQNGKVDVLTIEYRTNTCDGLTDLEILLTAKYQHDTGFNEPELVHNFGCYSSYSQAEGLTPPIRDIRDYNGDGRLDIATKGNIYIYSEALESYEADPRFRTILDSAELRYTENYPIDLNIDTAVDIITPIIDEENCGNNHDTCNQLSWAKNLNNGTYEEFAIFDNDYGSYSKFRTLDVDQNGTKELVVEFESLGYAGDPWEGETYSRWYTFDNESIIKYTIEPISDFVDLTGEDTPYFVDISNGRLSLYEYNNHLNRPVITEVQEITLYNTHYRYRQMTDVDKDGDIDILITLNNRIYLIENTYK